MPKEQARWMARWMWDDHKLAKLAEKNPLRWSKWKSIEDTVQELQSSAEKDRPLVIQINGKELKHQNIGQALTALRFERRPVLGDWVTVKKMGRDPNRKGLIIQDDGAEEEDCYNINYGGEAEPWVKETEVQLLPPVTDPAVWKTLLKDNGLLLQHAPVEIRNARLVAITAVSQNPHALKYITSTEALIAVVGRDGTVLKDAPDKVKANRQVAIAAVSKTPAALRYISDELRADPEVVRAAMARDQEAIQHASAHLQENPEELEVIGE